MLSTTDRPQHCPTCGRRSWRYRKKSQEFVCRSCQTVIPRTPPQPSRKGEAVDDLAFTLGVANLHLVLRDVVDEHEPRLGRLIPVLGVVTAALVGVLTAQRFAGLWATVLGASAGLMVMLLLWLARVINFLVRHPTLAEWHAEMLRFENADAATEEQGDRFMELTMLAAQQYVSDEDWELARRAFERAMGSE